MSATARQRLLSIVTIICIGALAGDKLIFTPLLNVWKDRSERIEELEKLLTKGELLLDREDTLKNRWNDMLTNELPANRSAAQEQVLKSLARWAADSSISIISFTPNWREYQEEYRTLECRTIAQGNLSNISRFLYEMEKEPGALKLDNVEIMSDDDRGSKLTLSIVFSGLHLSTMNQSK